MTDRTRKRFWSSRPGQGETVRWIRERVGYVGEECLMWPFAVRRGYGIFQCLGRRDSAHRYMCELTHGPTPSPLHHAAHSCGNPGCVNPKHISWKTPSENELDKRVHGTHHRRNGCPRWKVSEEQVAEIRASSKTSDELAAQLGISESHIRNIRKFRVWKTGKKGPTEFAIKPYYHKNRETEN